MGKTASEQACIARAKAGDEDAFTTLVELHTDRVYRALRGFGLNPTEAEDVAQEVFVRAWRGLRRFQGRAQLSTWLYRIAYNEAQRRLSSRPRLVVSHRRAEDAIDGLVEAPQLGPEQRALGHEFDAMLRRALTELPSQWREAIMLRDLEGLSAAEAAAAIGIREGAFKSRLHRGRMQLRLLLEPYLDEARPRVPRAA